jgi:hypothetical protein
MRERTDNIFEVCCKDKVLLSYSQFHFVLRRSDLEQGTTALMEASKLGHVEVVRILLKSNADPNWTNSAGETAVHYAAKNPVPTVLQVLVAHGGNVNAVDHEGRTALHWACQHNALQTALWLLSSTDINVTARDRQGRNALMYLSSSDLVTLHQLTENRYLNLAPLTVSDTEQLADEPPPPRIDSDNVSGDDEYEEEEDDDDDLRRRRRRSSIEKTQSPRRSSVQLSDISSSLLEDRYSETGNWQERYNSLLQAFRAWKERAKFWVCRY